MTEFKNLTHRCIKGIPIDSVQTRTLSEIGFPVEAQRQPDLSHSAAYNNFFQKLYESPYSIVHTVEKMYVQYLTELRSKDLAFDATLNELRQYGITSDELISGLISDTPTTDAISYNDDGMVSTYRVGSDTFTYTYNADGRITHIRKNNVLRQSYGYYADGQLRRENNLDTNKTIIYTYDNGGNITKKTEYPCTTSGTLGTATATINYTYDSTWKDKLTSYNGQSISYDAMGNPTSYRGATLTWFGRQLKSYTKDSTSVSYEYDENGLRTQKTVNGVVHDYYYVGDRLVYEKLGDEYEYFYCYDADGRLAMVERVIISSGAKGYFFTITNAQGDVIGIRSTTGAVIARYNYDAFGKLISTTDDSGNTLPSYSFAYQINVRYRGYYYDSETGLYYLQSRYYDPETGRFLNADDVNFLGATETLLSYNAFAYCENDPVNFLDLFGKTKVKLLRDLAAAYKGKNTLRTFSKLISKNFKNMYLAFHEMAQILIANKLESLHYREITLEQPCSDKKHEVDVYAEYDTRRGMKKYIWEVKTKGTSAEKQLRLYQRLNKDFLRGQNIGTIVRKITNQLYMKIEFNGRGGAFYSFENSKHKRITNAELKKSIENGVYAAIGIGSGVLISVAAMAIIASAGTASAPVIGGTAAVAAGGASVTPEILMLVIPIVAEFSKAA